MFEWFKYIYNIIWVIEWLLFQLFNQIFIFSVKFDSNFKKYHNNFFFLFLILFTVYFKLNIAYPRILFLLNSSNWMKEYKFLLKNQKKILELKIFVCYFNIDKKFQLKPLLLILLLQILTNLIQTNKRKKKIQFEWNFICIYVYFSSIQKLLKYLT